MRYIDPTGHYCVSANGSWAHGGECAKDSKDSKYLGDDKTYAGSPRIENGVLKGYLGISGPVIEEKVNYWNDFTFFGGFGSIRYGQDYSLGVKGWSFQVHRADDSTLTQRHVHVWGPKNQTWSQNEDGSPHDENKNSPGGPPNSMKKEIKKQIGWDWGAKAKDYAEKQSQINMLIQEAMLYYGDGLPEEVLIGIIDSVKLGRPSIPMIRTPRMTGTRPALVP